MYVRVGGLVLENDTVLLIRHDYDGGQLWHVPGGNLKEQETLTDALEREFLEELGLVVEVGVLWLVCDSIRPDGVQVLHCIFGVKRLEGEPVLRKAETSGVECAWVPVADISSLNLYPSIEFYVKELSTEYAELSSLGYIGRCQSRVWL
jgi:8-oxo-dGTP diphosphatase